MMCNTKILAVVGKPVIHSKSPDMFNAAFKALAMDAAYVRFAPRDVEEAVAGVKIAGISGFNVTSPYKEEIVPFLDDVDDCARRIGAVNTVLVHDGKTKGFNTDIEGVTKALLFKGMVLKGQNAVVLGAGGAARAAVYALVNQGSHVVITNRTFNRAEAIAADLGCRAVPLECIGEELRDTHILMSCLPTGQRIIDPHFLKAGLTIFDANYGSASTLVHDGKERGARICDGKEWLLFQGAASFRLFTGAEPPLDAMRSALYGEDRPRGESIALIGFMGAGKSEVASVVAERAGMPLLDIDREIERKAGSRITDIFETRGEDVFRSLEQEEIAGIPLRPATVVACGGGAVLREKNVKILERCCRVIWLWADVDTIVQRIGDDAGRPLMNVEDRRSRVEQLLCERVPLYARAADLLVRTDGKDPEEVAERIYGEIGRTIQG
jgi:shikimate dehydrogenase